ncbi:DUF6771 family protein [Sphingomonas sp.]|uniref:DUF6771 family protein n=1 Tax=Sphingomonas sp. TaxID=28214 RepID=UPI003CC54A5A
MATRIDPARVAELIAFSPGWARVALTAGNAELREAAADEIACMIADRHDDPPLCRHVDQLALPLA